MKKSPLLPAMATYICVCLLGVFSTGLVTSAPVLLHALLTEPANAQGLQPPGSPCTFQAITVTAANMRTLDTQPGLAISRTIYFAHTSSMPGLVTVSVALMDFDGAACYLWSSPAFDQATYLVRTITEAMPSTVLTYTVDAASGGSTLTLISSQSVAGSLALSSSHRVALTFTRDSTPPVSSVTSPVHAVPAGSTIPLGWQATDVGSGVLSVTLTYTDTQGTSGSIDLATTQGSMSFVPVAASPPRPVTYFFSTRAVDSVLNREPPKPPDVWVTVDVAHSYLPLVVREHPLPRPAMGSVTIEGGSDHVYRPVVTLALSDTFSSGVDSVAWMRLGNESATWGDWEAFNPIKSWQLSDGLSSLRTVYAQFRGSKGGISTPPVSDTAYLSLNGNFEYGALAPGWQGEANPLPVGIVPGVQERDGSVTLPADGSHAVLLGDPGYPCTPEGMQLGYAAITQTFRLPPGVHAKLTFQYIIWSQDASISGEYDRFEVYAGDTLAFSDGNQVNQGLKCEQWWRVPGPHNPRADQTGGWARGEIDLGGYAGQDVAISFRTYNRYDGWYNTYAYVDGVTIEPGAGGW